VTNKKGKHFTITLYSYFPFTKKSTSPLFIDKRNISIRNAQHNNNPFQPFFSFSFLCLCILLNGVVLFSSYWNYRQNKAMDGLQDDVEELNYRVKGANQRTRRLLGK
jgi:hypothetical protein